MYNGGQILQNLDGTYTVWVDAGGLGLVEVFTGSYDECIKWSFNTALEDNKLK